MLPLIFSLCTPTFIVTDGKIFGMKCAQGHVGNSPKPVPPIVRSLTKTLSSIFFSPCGEFVESIHYAAIRRCFSHNGSLMRLDGLVLDVPAATSDEQGGDVIPLSSAYSSIIPN